MMKLTVAFISFSMPQMQLNLNIDTRRKITYLFNK